jgi:hypothetical protein
MPYPLCTSRSQPGEHQLVLRGCFGTSSPSHSWVRGLVPSSFHGCLIRGFVFLDCRHPWDVVFPISVEYFGLLHLGSLS